MAAQLTIDQKIPFTLSFQDSLGNPARVDGIPSIVVLDPNVIVLVDLAADGLSGAVSAVAPGTAQVQVTADADLGAGIRTLSVIGDVEVLAGEAVVGAIAFGAAVPK